MKVRPHANNETLVLSLPSNHSLLLSPKLESWEPSLVLPWLHPLHPTDRQILQCLPPTHISSPSSPHTPAASLLALMLISCCLETATSSNLCPVSCPCASSIHPSDTQERSTYSKIDPCDSPAYSSSVAPTASDQAQAFPQSSLSPLLSARNLFIPSSPQSLPHILTFTAPSAVPLLLSLVRLLHLGGHPTPIFISICFISSYSSFKTQLKSNSRKPCLTVPGWLRCFILVCVPTTSVQTSLTAHIT